MDVPENVGADGVKAHRMGHTQAVLPILTRDSRVMHLAAANDEGLAVEQEILPTERECRDRVRHISQRKSKRCESRAQYTRNLFFGILHKHSACLTNSFSSIQSL